MLPIIVLDSIKIPLKNNNIESEKCSSITVYPITVEFDRLIRRQKLIRDHGSQSSFLLKNQQTSSEILPKQQPKLWSNDGDSILENCDANDLLYGTMVHYFAALFLEPLNQSKLETKSTFDEINSFDQLHQSLCAPGTRTLLLVTDKRGLLQHHEILSHLKENWCLSDCFNDLNDREDCSKSVKENRYNQGLKFNTSFSENCLSFENKVEKNSFHEPDNHRFNNVDVLKKNSITDKTSILSRALKIKSITRDVTPNSNERTTINNILNENSHQKSNLKYFQSLDRFIEKAFQRKQELSKRIDSQNIGENFLDDNEQKLWLTLIGIEQQIIGAITFYKSYHLESLKVIELILVAVKNQFRRLGIGKILLTNLKENNQIGIYDAIRVRIRSNDSQLKQFFLKQNFSDDLVLNASFDQLKSSSVGCSEEDDIEENASQDDQQHKFPYYQRESKKNLSYSHSLGQIDCLASSLSSKSSLRYFSKLNNIFNTESSVSLISMCYMPPFSVGTLNLNQTLRDHRTKSLTTTTMITEIDNRFVDDIIEQANIIWRRDMLSAYRTQWSCVSRLRSEIVKLRLTISQQNSIIEKMRRENFQLRNALVQKTKSTSSTSMLFEQQSSKTFALQKFQFDSLDF